MKKSAILFLFLFPWLFAKGQQDGHSSQYLFNGLYINPAYAGYKEEAYISCYYRSQWTGVEGAPRSMSLAADKPNRNRRVGLGLLVTHDRIGAQTSLSAYANYAYRIQIGQSSRLSFGLAAGFIQQGIDGSTFKPLEDEDTFLSAGMESEIIPDAKAGVLFSDDRFYAGISIDNIIAQYSSKKGRNLLLPLIKPHYYVTAGALFNVSEGIKFRPSFLVRDEVHTPSTLDLNAFMLLQERFWIGCFYRTAIKTYKKSHLQTQLPKQNALGLITEFLATDHIRIGYAFDYSLSNLQAGSFGTHEISLGMSLRKRK